jgi:ABC-type nitrate/sulfonate/bicarbonate transport system substrate-binding protein
MAGEIDYATILPTITVAAARGIPVKVLASVTKGSSFAMISRPEIDSIQGLKGKRIGINSFGSSLDYVVYAALSRSGLDPNKDVSILPIGGSTPDRIAAMASGSIDATAVTSPTEYTAERQGFRTLLSVRDLAKLVRINNTGIGATQKKIDKEPDEIVRVLRALRAAMMAIQEQRDYGIASFEKLRFDHASAKKFYALFRDQYNPDLSLPDPRWKTCWRWELSDPKKRKRRRSPCKPCATGVLPKGRGGNYGVVQNVQAVQIVQFAGSYHANRSNMGLSAAATLSAMRCMPAQLG